MVADEADHSLQDVAAGSKVMYTIHNSKRGRNWTRCMISVLRAHACLICATITLTSDSVDVPLDNHKEMQWSIY